MHLSVCPSMAHSSKLCCCGLVAGGIDQLLCGQVRVVSHCQLNTVLLMYCVIAAVQDKMKQISPKCSVSLGPSLIGEIH